MSLIERKLGWWAPIMALAVMAVLTTAGGPALAAQNRPILVITDYSTQPREVAPGAPFDLTLTLRNEGDRQAQQLLLTLESDSAGSGSPTAGSAGADAQTAPELGTAAPVSVLRSGNVRYIGDISAGSAQTVTFRLISSGDSRPRAYNLGFLLEYVNSSSGRDESSRQAIGLPLVRDAGLKVAALRTPKKPRVGQAFKITGDIINSGSFTVHGVTAEAIGNGFEIVREADFIGPLDGGDTDSFDIRLRPQKRSAREVKLTIGYRDDYNQERSITRTIELAPEKAQAAEADEGEKSAGGFFGAIARWFRALLGIGSGN